MLFTWGFDVFIRCYADRDFDIEYPIKDAIERGAGILHDRGKQLQWKSFSFTVFFPAPDASADFVALRGSLLTLDEYQRPNVPGDDDTIRILFQEKWLEYITIPGTTSHTVPRNEIDTLQELALLLSGCSGLITFEWSPEHGKWFLRATQRIGLFMRLMNGIHLFLIFLSVPSIRYVRTRIFCFRSNHISVVRTRIEKRDNLYPP